MAKLHFTLGALALVSVGFGQADQDVTNMSLDDLMRIDVTTPSKMPQSLATTPAALYVITAEDIAKSSATTIPDLLRVVPGISVGQINNYWFKVSARGFNAAFSDKMLVLVDGRSAYSVGFDGVFWDTVDVPLSDIQRIEVIRGPGGALWGDNAVNGVINIITKPANMVDPSTVTLSGGDHGRGLSEFSYSDALGDGSVRLSGKLRSENASAGQMDANDAWTERRLQFRYDADVAKGNLTIEGHTMQDREHAALPTIQGPVRAGFLSLENNLQAQWNRGATSAFFAATHSSAQNIAVNWRMDTYEAELKSQAQHGDSRLNYGFNWRQTGTHIQPGLIAFMVPPSRAMSVYGPFAQYETKAPKSGTISCGLKVEHNDMSGFEWMPNLRYTADYGQKGVLWGAITRVARTPSRLDRDLGTIPIDYGNGYYYTVLPNHSVKSEKLLAYESGYRRNLSANTTLDLAGYVNVYQDLMTDEVVGMDTYNGQQEILTSRANKMHGQTSGLEASVRHDVSRSWRLTVNYSYFSERLRLSADSTDQGDSNSMDGRGAASHNTVAFVSDANVNSRLGWMTELLYADKTIDGTVPGHWLCNMKWTYHLRPGIELFAAVRNLFDYRGTESVQLDSANVSSMRRQLNIGVAARF